MSGRKFGSGIIRILENNIKEALMHYPLLTIARFEFFENVRNKWLAIYALAFFAFTGLITYMGGSDPLSASMSLLNLVLLSVPLFTMMFGSISFTESLPFHDVLIAQPISRRDIYLGKWIGLGGGLSASYVIGMGLGLLFTINFSGSGIKSAVLLLFLGVLLTLAFLGIAFYVVNVLSKREVIFATVLVLWFVFFILYDLLVMAVAVVFEDYPLAWPMLMMVCFNPIDLVRLILLLQTDASAMMGYSEAIFQKYLGSGVGIAIGTTCLLLWIAIPTWRGLRRFERKDM